MLKLSQFRALSPAETPAFVKVTGSKFENDLKDFPLWFVKLLSFSLVLVSELKVLDRGNYFY